MTTSRQPIVAGNWKMNGNLKLVEQFKQALAGADLQNVDVVICPPFPYLSQVVASGVRTGAQNISQFESGAHTGEVSADMALEVGCQLVLVGHSERRNDNHESDKIVASKVKLALSKGLTPVLCIGEPEDVREQGRELEHIAAQLDAVIEVCGIAAFSRMVVAYEPIWAIGTGKTATPEQAQDVHRFIRQHLADMDEYVAQSLRILYGGSVKASNAVELFSQPDVDGGLIGGASLDPDSFISICQAANR